MSGLFYVFSKVKKYRLYFFASLFEIFIFCAEIIGRPMLVKTVLNRLIVSNYFDLIPNIFWPLFFYWFISFVHAIGSRFVAYFESILAFPLMRNEITAEAFDLLLNKSHGFYQNVFSGALVSKINDLRFSCPDLIKLIINRFCKYSIAIILTLIVLFRVDKIFAILMFAWIASFILFAKKLSPRLIKLSKQNSDMGSKITGKLVDILSNIFSVRLFAQKSYEKEAVNSRLLSAKNAEQELEWAYMWLWVFYGVSFVFFELLAIFFLVIKFKSGLISAGDFVLVLGISQSIVSFLWRLADEFCQFSRHLGKINQALIDIFSPQVLFELPDADSLKVVRGEIVFDEVSFSYQQSNKVFNRLTIAIKAGEKVGLVGFSGAGKSSFVNLLLRLYDLQEGQILIDGQNIKNVTQESLHQSISVIPQDPVLFHRSLFENIAYGKKNASQQEVIAAAKIAKAHDFICEIEQGYQAMVGERGVKLSGGQRQRIAIARAVLKNAPILILDEATSQLDSLTEAAIAESVSDAFAKQTTIVIAHRLSTLQKMDRILVFDGGKVIEEGSCSELLAKNGLYRKMWNEQTQEALF